MFNKESCRSCGEFLVPDMICIECDEIILWICSNCTNTSEHTHIHNQDKVGEPFQYPNTFLLLLGYAKIYFHLPFRQTEGIARGHAKGKVPSIPDYTTINRRINQFGCQDKRYR